MDNLTKDLVVHKLVGVKFTYKKIRDFFENRKGWKEVDRNKERWQSMALHFDYKNNFGLSIVAGDNLYSIPRKKAKEYKAVEIGLLFNDSLII